MIKTIKKFQIKLTPFDATKEWNMSSTNNQDLLLVDTGSYTDPEVPIALEFIDYGEISDPLPTDNFECDIALEQQPDDLINTRIGLNVLGLFYPQFDPTNADGTYQRVVFSQVRTMFYNQFRDPTKMWGMNNIDFNLSKTKRKISDQIRLFDTPQFIYGDQLVPNTITLVDDSIDDVFSITDDGFGNLIAGSNLFAKRQEIGKYPNTFIIGSDSTCNTYFSFLTSSASTGSSSSSVCAFDSSLTASSYAISGYFDGMISSSIGFSPPFPGDVVWNGTFTLYFVDNINDFFCFYGFDRTSNFPAASVITNHDMCNEYLSFRCSGSIPVWNFYIIDSAAEIVYSAIKTGSNSPVGIYTNDSGSTLTEIFLSPSIPFTSPNTSSILLTPVTISIVTNPTPSTSSVAAQDVCGTV